MSLTYKNRFSLEIKAGFLTEILLYCFGLNKIFEFVVFANYKFGFVDFYRGKILNLY